MLAITRDDEVVNPSPPASGKAGGKARMLAVSSDDKVGLAEEAELFSYTHARSKPRDIPRFD